MAGDVLRGRQRCWVVPGCIFIFLAVHQEIVVTGRALPAAYRLRVALLEILAMNRVGWKVVVAFDDFSLGGFGKNGTIPDGLGHDGLPVVESGDSDLTYNHSQLVIEGHPA